MAESTEKKKTTLADLKINYSRKDSKENFIDDNIEYVNYNISCFSETACKDAGLEFDGNDIKNVLHQRLVEKNESFKNKLFDEFKKKEFKKNKIKEIAIANRLYYNDLEKLFEEIVFKQLSAKYSDKLSKSIVSIILKYAEIPDDDKNKFKYYSSVVMPIMKKSLYLSLRNGFSSNLNDTESGLMTANAGDSAQFLFLARAILAGYNCSNVDVRSSRYDAVIDKNGKLFRVQVKGTSGTTVSFKDRNRGGRGINSKNERNQGKRITSKDCDIYVAVDKQFGICYIIPTKKIDEWDVDSKSTKELSEYKEKWKTIDELAE